MLRLTSSVIRAENSRSSEKVLGALVSSGTERYQTGYVNTTIYFHKMKLNRMMKK